MKNRKNLLCLAFFIMLMTNVMTSCGIYYKNCGRYHKNVVIQMENNGWLIEDVVTHQKRIIELDNKHICRSFVEHTHTGDTILVRALYYKERLVLQTDISTALYFNYDSIIYRQNKAEFEAKKQQLFQEKTR